MSLAELSLLANFGSGSQLLGHALDDHRNGFLRHCLQATDLAAVRPRFDFARSRTL